MLAKVVNNRMRAAAGRLFSEVAGMSRAQQHKVIVPLLHAPTRLVEAKVAELQRARHRRRKARLTQKASRQRNRR